MPTFTPTMEPNFILTMEPTSNAGVVFGSSIRGSRLGKERKQREPATDVLVVALNEEHTICPICFTEFSFDTNNVDKNIKRHLPVL